MREMHAPCALHMCFHRPISGIQCIPRVAGTQWPKGSAYNNGGLHQCSGDCSRPHPLPGEVHRERKKTKNSPVHIGTHRKRTQCACVSICGLSGFRCSGQVQFHMANAGGRDRGMRPGPVARMLESGLRPSEDGQGGRPLEPDWIAGKNETYRRGNRVQPLLCMAGQ